MDISKLLDELGASGEDRSGVEKFFQANPSAASKASGWYENGLRQSDYDRKMNMLKAEHESAMQRVNETEQTLATTREGMNGQYLQAIRDREEAERKLSSVQARIKSVTTSYQVPLTEFDGFLSGDNPNPGGIPNPANPNPANNDQYVSREDFNTVVDLTKRLPMLPVTLMKLQREHHELTGTYFDEQTLMDKALELRKPIGEVADMMYGLTQKRQEKHDSAIRAEERSKADTEWKAKISREGANPIRSDIPGSQPGPVFNLKRPDVPNVPGPRPDRLQSGVEAAVAAFREGKYRQDKSA